MANTYNNDNVTNDDIISYCGSMSGETFSSRRRKNTCTLRQHRQIDLLAQRLREGSCGDLEKQPEDTLSECKPRLNTSFHNYRFLVVMLSGFSLGSMILLRYNITVAILNMVNQTALYMEEHPNKTMDDFIEAGYSPGGEFHWDNEIQHMIMSWYMVAYTLPQVPCTKLSIAIGSRLAMPMSLLICAISTLLTPTAAYWGWQWVIGLRLINGIGASAVLPLMLNIIEHWMPYDEISLGLTCAQVMQASLTAGNPLLIGYLSSFHWKYAFYIPGVVTIGFCVIWLLLVSDTPDQNRLVSQKELDLICGCTKIGGNHDRCARNGTAAIPKPPPPSAANNQNDPSKAVSDKLKATALEKAPLESKGSWVDVLRVPSFYAYIFMWCFYCSSYSVFTFILPTYMRQFLKIGVSQNGLYCFMIQSGCVLSVLWPHPFLRLLQTRLGLSITASRRVTHAVICLSVAATWFYVGLFHETQLLLLFLNRCFHGSNDIVVTGSLMSNYAKAGLSSLIFSMVNTVGNLSVVFASTFVGYVLDKTAQSREGWTYILASLAGSQLLMLLTFTTIIRSEPIDLGKSRRKKSNNLAITTNQNGQQQPDATNINATLNGIEIVSGEGKKFECNSFDKLKNGFDHRNSIISQTNNNNSSPEQQQIERQQV